LAIIERACIVTRWAEVGHLVIVTRNAHVCGCSWIKLSNRIDVVVGK
jgi:hypothetical protein